MIILWFHIYEQDVDEDTLVSWW